MTACAARGLCCGLCAGLYFAGAAGTYALASIGLVGFEDLTEYKKEGTTNIPITTSIGKLSGTATEVISKIRAGAQDYNTQFMLKLAVNDIEKMLESGQWTLPEEVDFKLIKELATTSPDFNEGK